MQLNNYSSNAYCIEFKSDKEDHQQAGFETCLAIASLEYPLVILLSRAQKTLTQKLQSLVDFELAFICFREDLSDEAYEKLREKYSFYLAF